METKRKEPESQRISWFLYSFELKDLGIGIVFEKENINTLDAKGEVLLIILSSLAQDESRSSLSAKHDIFPHLSEMPDNRFSILFKNFSHSLPFWASSA
jgi:hypothetical protein